MNWQTWGVFLVVLGLVQVILAGFFLRQEKSGKASSSRKAAEGTGGGSIFWIWVGRLGAICCMAGVWIIVTKS